MAKKWSLGGLVLPWRAHKVAVLMCIFANAQSLMEETWCQMTGKVQRAAAQAVAVFETWAEGKYVKHLAGFRVWNSCHQWGVACCYS